MKNSPLLFATLLLSVQLPAPAADWGYEDQPPARKAGAQHPVEEASASGFARSLVPGKSAPPPGKKPAAAGIKPAAAASGMKPVGSGTSAIKPKPDAKNKPHGVPSPVKNEEAGAPQGVVDRDKQAAICWLQLFQGSSKEHLSFEYQKRIEKYMLNKAALGGKNSDEVLSILKFWPKFIFQLKGKPELEFQYADLFRALLRIRQGQSCETLALEGPDKSDSELISELLGPERIAVSGNPPLTEAAINAYADMACFIYEQQHDGKTIDANDNRALFARVVADKFKEAPTDQDRKAMANFDLVWAKFKIVWFSSNEKTRQVLLQKLVKTGAGSTLTVAKEPVMEQILSTWPWAR